jgi:hypothetical protein
MSDRAHAHSNLTRTMLWFVTVLVLSVSGSAFAQHIKPTKILDCSNTCNQNAPESIAAALEVTRQSLPGPMLLGLAAIPTLAPIPSQIFALEEITLEPILLAPEIVVESNPRAPPMSVSASQNLLGKILA